MTPDAFVSPAESQAGRKWKEQERQLVASFGRYKFVPFLKSVLNVMLELHEELFVTMVKRVNIGIYSLSPGIHYLKCSANNRTFVLH